MENTIVFCCAKCGIPVIQNSREHDECITSDGEEWFCGNCHEFCISDFLSQDDTDLENESTELPENVNRCVCCGICLGDQNPRQLCEKTYCPFEEGEFAEP